MSKALVLQCTYYGRMKAVPALKDIREARALSQRDLAKLSGVAHDTIGQIERGERKARPSTLRRLADALRVEPLELLATGPLQLMVIKRDGRREPFDRVKLLTGISKACVKRQVPEERIELIVDEIEAYVRERYGHQVRSVRLTDLALARLKQLDEVSFLRFASVSPTTTTDVDLSQLSQWTREALTELRSLRRRLRSDDRKEVVEVELAQLDERVKELIRDLDERMNEDEHLSVHYQREVLQVVEELLDVHIEVFRSRVHAEVSRELLEVLLSKSTRSPSLTESVDFEGESKPYRRFHDAITEMNLSERQQKVLITVLEQGKVGLSTLAESLEISVSTAYRDLSMLEEHGLIIEVESGKRQITPLGRHLVMAIVDDNRRKEAAGARSGTSGEVSSQER